MQGKSAFLVEAVLFIEVQLKNQTKKGEDGWKRTKKSVKRVRHENQELHKSVRVYNTDKPDLTTETETLGDRERKKWS